MIEGNSEPPVRVVAPRIIIIITIFVFFMVFFFFLFIIPTPRW